MLLFSTLLDLKDTFSEEQFVELVLKWNKETPMDVNRIPNLDWNGEWGTRFGSEDLWIQFDKYEKKNIVAVRYQKNDNGALWNTDYIMNFDTMKLAVQLDRSYTDTMPNNKMFSAPLFVSTLVDAGVIKNDGDLQVLNVPQIINQEDNPMLAKIISFEKEYRMPVVYVSRTEANDFIVDVDSLARRLRGVAHVLIQGDVSQNGELRGLTDNKNEFYGAIGIYCSNGGIPRHKKYLPRNNAVIGSEYDDSLKFMVINWVNRFTNDQLMEPLYTWLGVQNALANDRMESARAERFVAQQEVNDVYAAFDEEINELQRRNQEMANEIASLRSENQGLRGKLYRSEQPTLLYYGAEEDLYQKEILDYVMETIEKGLQNTEQGSRRAHVLQDILDNNEYPHVLKERRELLKATLSNYTELDKNTKSKLKELGFTLSSDNKHYRMIYCGDSRYKVTLAKTPSDERGSKNNVSEISKICF